MWPLNQKKMNELKILEKNELNIFDKRSWNIQKDDEHPIQ